MTLSYKGTVARRRRGSDTRHYRSLTKASLANAATWRIATSQSSGGESASVDTFDLDANDPHAVALERPSGQRDGRHRLQRNEGHGRRQDGRAGNADRRDASASAFGDGSSLETLVGALPLAPGYETTLRVYDFQMQQTRAMSLKVVGTESVTVPAGTYECFNVEIRPIGDESGASRIYVSAKDPRCMIRGTFELPPQMGGDRLRSISRA